MMKALELRASAVGSQAKAGAAAPVRRSALVSVRAPVSRRHQAFKGARRPVVQVAAAAEAEPKAAKIPLASVTAGSEFEGRVTKVEAYGAFVDFGAASQGLVHISQLSDKYIKNAADVVAVNDVVKVKVLSVDASANRVALTMKGVAAAASASVDAEDEPEDVVDDEEEGLDEEVEVEEMLEAEEGNELVDVDDEPDFMFQMAEEDPEMTLESVAAFEALGDDEWSVEVDSSAMPVPIGAEVTGKVSRVEEYGVFVDFAYNGKTFTGLLAVDEAKVPAAALSEEERAEFANEDGTMPTYVAMDIESSIDKYYKSGQEVSAIVLEYTEQNKIGLTQWADWELDLQAAEELGDEAEFVEDEMDVLAMDPLDLMEADASDNAPVLAEADFDGELLSGSEMRREAGVSSQGRLLSAMMGNMYEFQSRSIGRVDAVSLNRLARSKVTDFDLDQVTLADVWTESFHIPKDALQQIGMKLNVTESGDVEVVEREGGAPADIDWNTILQDAAAGRNLDREARVAAFVKDLLDEDEDEAELPALAGRRPVALAAAVQNISATTVKELRNKTGAGMMDCKKALAENDNDMEKAMEVSRQ